MRESLQIPRRAEVENAALTATNAALTTANASLTTMNASMTATISFLHTKLANSVSIHVFREVHSAAAAPVIEAIHAVNGRHASASTIEAQLESQDDVVQLFTALGWSKQEIEPFKNQGVTGEVLLTDVTAAMCESFGVSPLHIATLTRTLQKWKKGWGGPT